MLFEPRHEKTVFLAYAKTKWQISFVVIAQLTSAFAFATQIVQTLYFLITKFQASSHLLELYSLVCVEPGRKPEDSFLMTRLICFYESEEKIVVFFHVKASLYKKTSQKVLFLH